MKLAIASDHAGFDYKSELIPWLKSKGFEVKDFGCFAGESVDYPDFAFAAAKTVGKGKNDYGILICGTGIGVSITANKVDGIRAANCCSAKMAELARRHNDANILTFGARLIELDLAKEIILTFLNTNFEAGRHKIRVDKIHSLTGK